ncbi:MAG: hypothetical protein KF884_07540 [Fimbriimonadaceae bacterium]|nr:hypothetical protein [Fimbriimonadaceae bacterium]QYK57402.1 MAG: hypothetical protein KF884_07540 [Fimbriimonadaceae bacterium]
MFSGRSLGTVLAALTLVPVALAQSNQTEQFLGPEVGVFFPTSSKLKDRLGDSWFSFGFGRSTAVPGGKTRTAVDWTGFSKSSGGNKVFMGAVTFGAVLPLGETTSEVVPYVAGRAGLSYIDYAINVTPAQREGGKRLGYNANAEIGVNIGKRVNLAVRYDVFPQYDGFRFDGLSITLKYGLTRF